MPWQTPIYMDAIYQERPRGKEIGPHYKHGVSVEDR